MYTRKEDVESLEQRFGCPEPAEMEYEIKPWEYDVVKRSMRRGRAHDVTFFVRNQEDPSLIAVIRKPFFPAGAFRVPSGAAHPDEGLEKGAMREAMEETGLQVELTRYLVRISTKFTCSGREPIDWTTHIFEARETGGRLVPRDTFEIEEARWAGLDEIQGPIREVLVQTGWDLFRYRVALTDMVVEILGTEE
ncbi:MAG: NUDIX hydrolase [Actinomycetota bacterium]